MSTLIRVTVTYARFPEVGFGYIPIIDPAETSPGEVIHPDDRDLPRHYAEAARLESEYQAKHVGAR